jgi:hypothetical protein
MGMRYPAENALAPADEGQGLFLDGARTGNRGFVRREASAEHGAARDFSS